MAILLSFVPNAQGYDQVVLLAPAAADIFSRLNLSDKVVGVTKNVQEFPDAKQVGSHIRPNAELIKVLKPDLIVISSSRFFEDSVAAAIGADVITYAPETLEGILSEITHIGALMDRQAEAEDLVITLREKLTQVRPVTGARAVFEVTAVPYTLAGQEHIVSDIIRAAGGENALTDARKLVKYSAEGVLALAPACYIWQEGPMNKNPIPPAERPEFARLGARYFNVNETDFSRANTRTFDNVLLLNAFFAEGCAAEVRQ